MALLFADNFSQYGIGATGEAIAVEGVYAEISGSLQPDPDGVSPGQVLFGRFGFARKVLPYTNDVTGVAFRLWCTNLPAATASSPGVALRDVNNNNVCGITVGTTGEISVRQGSVGQLINPQATTTGPVITAKGWYHIEFQFTRSTGAFKVFVEGREVLDGTGSFPTSGAIAQMAIGLQRTAGGALSTEPWYFKDLVIWDGSGTYNNAPLGSVQVIGLNLDSDVEQPWAPTPAGTPGYEILRTVPPSNSRYLTAGLPVPDPYIGTFSALPEDTTSVKGVVTFVRAAKSDGGDAAIQVGVISGVDVGTGADHPISTAQTYWMDVFETDPATDLPWAPSALDDANLQLARTL